MSSATAHERNSKRNGLLLATSGLIVGFGALAVPFWFDSQVTTICNYWIYLDFENINLTFLVQSLYIAQTVLFTLGWQMYLNAKYPHRSNKNFLIALFLSLTVTGIILIISFFVVGLSACTVPFGGF
ncbi:MAG TPA: hypothetical protein VFN56_01085 [Candidatus Saccharimonadales bacterium]|nr:hypothetical protein [Candidatus Saccharimonadales bacterium]